MICPYHSSAVYVWNSVCCLCVLKIPIYTPLDARDTICKTQARVRSKYQSKVMPPATKNPEGFCRCSSSVWQGQRKELDQLLWPLRNLSREYNAEPTGESYTERLRHRTIRFFCIVLLPRRGYSACQGLRRYILMHFVK